MRISFLQLTLCLSVRLSHVFVLGYNLQACICLHAATDEEDSAASPLP